MVTIGILCAYDWPGWTEQDWITFPLCPNYGDRVDEVYATILGKLLAVGVVELLDDTGEAWGFHRGTIRAVAVW